MSQIGHTSLGNRSVPMCVAKRIFISESGRSVPARVDHPHRTGLHRAKYRRADGKPPARAYPITNRADGNGGLEKAVFNLSVARIVKHCLMGDGKKARTTEYEMNGTLK